MLLSRASFEFFTFFSHTYFHDEFWGTQTSLEVLENKSYSVVLLIILNSVGFLFYAMNKRKYIYDGETTGLSNLFPSVNFHRVIM